MTFPVPIESQDDVCPVHRTVDGYRPTSPEGTTARAFEDLGHAWRVFDVKLVAALREVVLWPVDRVIGRR